MRIISSTPDFRHILYMAQVVEARDPYTAGHLWRVAQFSKLLGKQVGLQRTELFHLTLGAYLHDFGKISVPDQVLNKKGRLESGELTQVRAHCQMGYKMLSRHELTHEIAALARDHHEHWDGNGYPNQLDNTNISLGARILGICDSFDAMTSNRPYRDGMTIKQAKELIRKAENIQFDPELVKAFLQLNEADLAHITGHSDLNRPLLACPVCGPVIELPEAGQETTFCRVCTGKFNVKQEKTGKVSIEFSGEYGKPKDLIPNPNMDHVNSLFSEFYTHNHGNHLTPAVINNDFQRKPPLRRRRWRDLLKQQKMG